MTHAAGGSVDSLCAWLNDRFGCRLPRLADLGLWPPLQQLWRTAVDEMPDADAPLPIAVTAQGSWEILPGLVVSQITIRAAAI